MKTLGEVLQLSTDYLSKKEIVNPRRSAEELLAFFLKKERIELYMSFDQPMEEAELEQFRPLLKRAAQKEPIAYITEHVSFFHCDIKVNRSVLIPRPETEILTTLIAKDLAQRKREGKIFLDLCCGSGYMGIAVKKAFPELDVILIDLSSEAIALARENAERNQVDVTLLAGDLFAPLIGLKVDFLACNPPYIAAKDYEALDASVRLYEPSLALIGGATGLEIFQRIFKEAPTHLAAGAKLYFEIGFDQKEALLAIAASPPWQKQRIEKDWAGHDRFFFLENESPSDVN
jgi:release factor glutamine methyltransferase